MGYLRLKDYSVHAQQELNQIINNDQSIRLMAEFEALEEVKSYLRPKYDVSKEFADISIYNLAKAYNAGDRVAIQVNSMGFLPFDATAIYAIGEKTVYVGIAYLCKADVTAPGPFSLANWTRIGADDDLFYGTFPQPEYNSKNLYNQGDQIYWKSFTYQALKSSSILSHEVQLQYPSQESIPTNASPFPDMPGQTFWGSKTAHSIIAGTTPADPAWTFGDLRNGKIVQVMVDVVIYHLWSRGAPRNIPPLRIDRYKAAINWLENIAAGNIATSLPLIQPSQGSRIRYGGDVKNVNGY
jgi:hypothetical protein